MPGADAHLGEPRRHGALPIDVDIEEALDRRVAGDTLPLGLPPHWARPTVLAAVVLGGFLGTLARYGVGAAWPTPTGHFPTATFVINTSGAFLLGSLLTLPLERAWPMAHFRPFLATGLLGGWTTYSTFAVDADVLAKGGHLLLAVGYLAATLGAGIAAVMLGMAAATAITARQAGRQAGRQKALVPAVTRGDAAAAAEALEEQG